MKHIYAVCLLFSLSTFHFVVNAKDAVVLAKSYILHDEKGEIDLLQILADDVNRQFTRLDQQVVFLRNREGFYWLKIVPTQVSNIDQLIWVHLPSICIDSAEVFFVQPRHGLEHFQYSQITNFATSAGLDKLIAFPFYPVGKENCTIYVKIRIKQAGFISARLTPENQFYRAQNKQSLYEGLLVMLVVILVVLLVLYARNDYQRQTDVLAISMILCTISVLVYNGMIAPFSSAFGLKDDLGLVTVLSLMMCFQAAYFYFSFKHALVFGKYRSLSLVFILGFLLLSIFPWFAGSYFSFNWVLISGVVYLGFATYVAGILALKRLKPARNLALASGMMLICVAVFAFLASKYTPFAILPVWIEGLLLFGLLGMHFVQCLGLLNSYYEKQNKKLAFFEKSYREIRHQKNNLTLETLCQKRVIELQEQKTAENYQRFEATLRHIDHQKSIIEEKNKDIMDGIRYAHRIQNSLLSHREKMKEQLPASFVIFQPKDIVSGDFFFCANLRNTKGNMQNKVLLAAIDCAGHGVSGALLAVIGNLMLNNIVSEGRLHSPAEILYELDVRLNHIIGNQQSEYPLNHGMDISLCVIDKSEQQLVYAGARRPLMLFHKGVLHEIKGSKSSVGVNLTDSPKVFFDTDISYQSGDTFYLFTDGYVDQFAEKGGRKFMVSQFRELLTEIQTMQTDQQEKRLESAINTWKGIDKQTDDILVMGVRV